MLKQLRDRLSPVAYQGVAARAGRARGFTLLELLIVIALLAILAVVVILVLNPAETLRRARDSQRISDLSSIKSALGLYLTDAVTPDMDGLLSGVVCQGTLTSLNNVIVVWGGRPTTATPDITDASFAGGPVVGSTYTTLAPSAVDASRDALFTVDSAGWVPVDLSVITGGAPLANYPSEPNFLVGDAADIAEGTGVATGDRLYVYACGEVGGQFPYEINANLEAANNVARETGDGGNEADVFEVGTDLNLISTW